MILFYDTETTGLPKNWKAKMTNLDNWPRVIELGWQLYTDDGQLVEQCTQLIRPDGWKIPNGKFWVENGFFQERSEKEGIPIKVSLELFSKQIQRASLLVAHNMSYDYNVLGAEYIRAGMSTGKVIPKFCTKENGTKITKIPGRRGTYKWPTLSELHKHLFDKDFEDAHHALVDVEATAKCFFEMKKQNLIPEQNIAVLR